MKKSTIALIVIVILVFSSYGWIKNNYNGFVTNQTLVTQKWSDVETQYQRRFDLIPNVQATVSGAADFEQSTFVAVTAARSAWANALKTPERSDNIAAIGSFDSALSRLLVTVENYPQLKATEAFVSLITTLEGTENRIAQARKQYNESVTVYNTSLRIFPGNLLGKLFGFAPESFFESNPDAAAAPQVNFEKQQ